MCIRDRIKHMQHEVWYKYPETAKRLPSDITFVTTQELEDRWPDKSPKERENLITQEHGLSLIHIFTGLPVNSSIFSIEFSALLQLRSPMLL